MQEKKNSVKDSIYFKVWDYLILLLVLFSIFLLIQSYFELTPEIRNKKESLNLIISFIFVIDVTVRIILFKKKYLFSPEIIIDVLACSDIITPALRAVRSMKYTRLVRILRLLRMLRIFRGLKAVKHVSSSALEEKLFNVIAIIMILGFIFLAMYVTSFIESKFLENTQNLYKKIITSVVINSSDKKQETDPLIISKQLSVFHNIVYARLDLKGLEEPFLMDQTSDKSFSQTYAEEDILEVKLNEKIIIKVLIKEMTFYFKLMEFFILIASLPILFVLLTIIHLILKKHYNQPLEILYKTMENFDSRQSMSINQENNMGLITDIQIKYNEIISKFPETGSRSANIEGGDLR